jgi:G3E family GTPase
VAVADELVITKTDLVDPEAVDRLADTLAALNPSAAVRTARHGVVAERSARRAHARRDTAPARADTGHTADVRQLSLDPGGALDWLGFSVWLSMLLHAHGERVLRVKGIVEIDPGGYVAVNAVQHVVHRPEHLLAGAVSDVRPRIVFITRGLAVDGFAGSLATFQAAAHA